jgi:hypothetical protein
LTVSFSTKRIQQPSSIGRVSERKRRKKNALPSVVFIKRTRIDSPLFVKVTSLFLRVCVYKKINIMTQSRKSIIEKLIDAVSGSKIKDLDHYLEDNVQKTLDSKVVYNNLEEAEEYYKKEQDGQSTSQWTIVECEPEDPDNNTLRARISHDNKTADTIYTFSPSGKIQRIDVVN